MKRIKQAATKESIKAIPKKDAPDTMRLPKDLKDKILEQAVREKNHSALWLLPFSMSTTKSGNAKCFHYSLIQLGFGTYNFFVYSRLNGDVSNKEKSFLRYC